MRRTEGRFAWEQPARAVAGPATRRRNWVEIIVRLAAPWVGLAVIVALPPRTDGAVPAAVILPFAYVVVGMALVWSDRQRLWEAARGREARKWVRNWHALHLLSLLVVMFFEIVACVGATSDGGIAELLPLLAFLYAVYSLIAIAAVASRARAQRLTAG